MGQRVLIVEDDKNIARSVAYAFGKAGYETQAVSSGRQAVHRVQEWRPHLVLLDLILPDGDGFDVCRILRRRSDVPIIMLTAKVEEVDRVVGLELGADDYVTKPFSMRELIARAKAVLRRAPIQDQEAAPVVLTYDDLVIDDEKREVTLRGKIIELTLKEYELLRTLALHPGRVMTRAILFERVWGETLYPGARTLDVHIRWLREKIEEDPSRPQRILTVRGVGYKFVG